MKKLISLLLALCLALTAVSALASSFTDSVGRTVEIAQPLERIAVTGPLAQIVLFALAPDMLVGLANEWDPEAKEFVGEYYNLPYLGQLYGGKGVMNLEEIAAVDPQVIIDVGEPKDSVAEDLDQLQDQVGIPFVHVSMTTQSAPQAYRKLGELLNRPQEAETLAAYCEHTYAMIQDLLARVGDENKIKALYCLGDQGLNVSAKGSYHAEIIDMLTDNAAVIENPSSRGTGNEVDMEQLLLWDPDFILFAPDSIGAEVADDPQWQGLKAISSGNYAIVPLGPYNWLGFPPSVQRILGMLWMAQLFYPQACQFDLFEETARYYQLFYHCDLTREQFDRLTADRFAGQ